ncbi:uncharacterized protein LOC135682404 [Rhopilema esculentum]|uniref:uncharacterized protein LOC135682404 n=1 Tax=Rhopilema esculentum TaxID=499914 RepID=UPI0031DA7254
MALIAALASLAIVLAVLSGKADIARAKVDYLNDLGSVETIQNELNQFPIINEFSSDVDQNKNKESGLRNVETYSNLDVSSLRKAKAFFNNIRNLKGNYAGFRRRDYSIPNLASSSSLNTEESNLGKRNEKHASSVSYAKATDVERQMEDLKVQIVNTTLEIDKLYKSLMVDAKNGSGNKSKAEMAGSSQSIDTLNSNREVVEACGQNSKCCNLEEINRLRDNIRTEKEVRNQMIRFLAKAKVENSRISKALEAILRYYRPNEKVLNSLGISTRLKRVILAERIKMLPKSKQKELARRWNHLRITTLKR